MTYRKVALAYGSNLGNRDENIDKALIRLTEYGLQNLIRSEAVGSSPVDCPDGSGDFLNGALIGEWSGSCRELMEICQKIENELGRPQVREVNSPRPIDLDILLFDEEIINESDLKVPHMRMHLRDFVLGPLAEIASEWIIPDRNCTVKQCFEDLK